jgi:uncharacterized protein YggE
MKPTSNLIRVQGSGLVSCSPDTVIVGVELVSEHRNYEKATADASRKLELLRNALPKAELSAEQLKTEAFNVGMEHDYHAGTHTFRGYSVKHRLSLRLAFEPVLLGRVLAVLAASKTQANLSLTFTVADPEVVKRRVLEDAVNNARSRAEIIARAAGQRLGPVHAIEYGHTEIFIGSEPHGLNIYSDTEARPMDLKPADLQASDTVLITWEIETA